MRKCAGWKITCGRGPGRIGWQTATGVSDARQRAALDQFRRSDPPLAGRRAAADRPGGAHPGAGCSPSPPSWRWRTSWQCCCARPANPSRLAAARLSEELAVIARNERRFLGFSDDDTGFDPDRYKGKVVVATMHKAKGLEWDRVYLMSVNNYDFPSGCRIHLYIAEKWYLRDNLNLQAEALAQLEAALAYQPNTTGTRKARPRQSARLDYVRERLRLLYVGITRARRSWSSPGTPVARGESHPTEAFRELSNSGAPMRLPMDSTCSFPLNHQYRLSTLESDSQLSSHGIPMNLPETSSSARQPAGLRRCRRRFYYAACSA